MLKEDGVPLPEGYVLRHPEPSDAEAVQAVLDASESADAGEPRRHDNDVATEWRSAKCDPSKDWWVAAAPGGGIAAAGWVWPETPAELTADHYVDPGHRGRGLGEVMLDAIEKRAVELTATSEGLRSLVVWCADTDVIRRASLDRRGFVTVRQYFEMEIALDASIDPPVWPAGVSVRGIRSGLDEEAAYQADQEAFVEHHLYRRLDYDEWRLFQLDSSGADATLWRLAWDGDDVAGLVIPFETDRGAVIDDLAVRKPWRGYGIGHALLLEAFGALRARGHSVARLMVDAGNVTNAVRVYEAAGMHVSRRFDVMEKPLA
jgi:GNAT superfamily N-acetyltransferase